MIGQLFDRVIVGDTERIVLIILMTHQNLRLEKRCLLKNSCQPHRTSLVSYTSMITSLRGCFNITGKITERFLSDCSDCRDHMKQALISTLLRFRMWQMLTAY